MSSDSDHDVIVVGAGINGCVIARELAPDHDVLVIDKGQVASETTAKASGLISIVHDYADFPDGARHAIDFFEDYDGTGNFELTERSSVELVLPEHAEERRAAAEAIAANGFDVEYLEPDEVEARFPDTFHLDRYAGAIDFQEGGWVDPYTLAITLQEDAEADGATFETGVAVEEVLVEGDEVVGVRTDDGERTAPNVVVAAGWRTKALVDDWLDLPIRPFRYQTINLETDREFEDWYPVAWERETMLYWRPEHNGDFHVGGGTYYSSEPPDVRTTVTEEFRTTVAEAIFRYVKGIEDATIASADICPEGDTATPDGVAIVDAPAEAPDGLVVATGMHGYGIMASPVTGTAARAHVTGEDAPFDLEPLAYDRFGPDADFSETHISESAAELPSP